MRVTIIKAFSQVWDDIQNYRGRPKGIGIGIVKYNLNDTKRTLMEGKIEIKYIVFQLCKALTIRKRWPD